MILPLHDCRYISQPAVSEKRLSLTRQGKVRYQLKTRITAPPGRVRTRDIRARGFHCQTGRSGAHAQGKPDRLLLPNPVHPQIQMT